jgi:hypothetical protein
LAKYQTESWYWKMERFSSTWKYKITTIW